MKERRIEIGKDAVYRAVSMAAEYAGAKKGDESAYDRMMVTDENAEILDTYWEKSKSLLCVLLKEVLSGEEEIGGKYSLTLELSNLFDDTLFRHLNQSIFVYLVSSMTAEWYAICDKEDYQPKAAEAAVAAETIKLILYSRKRPDRPKHNNE